MKKPTNGIYQEQYENGIISVDVDHGIIRVLPYGKSAIAYHFEDEITVNDIVQIKESHKLV